VDTWWHVDGSLTQRTTQLHHGVTVPVTVRLRPSRDVADRDSDADASGK
jgi:hypothetical protein